jgi:MoaA/NifB/PqqE/SkfB family radical SAM enzyme
VIHEREQLQRVELPRFAQIEPVGKRPVSRGLSAMAILVDGRRGGPPGLLSFDGFCRLLEQLPGLAKLHLAGASEPLLHPRFFDMVRHAAALGIEVSTATRLSVLNQRRAEECVKSGLRSMHVPLDAAGTRICDFSRSGAGHERLLRHLRFLCLARREHGGAGPRISLGAVVMRGNLAGLCSLVRLAHEHGADALSVLSLADFIESNVLGAGRKRVARLVESEALRDEDLERVERHFGEALVLAGELGVGLELPEIAPRPSRSAPEGARPLVQGGRGRCSWPWHGAYIGFSGEAKPCAAAADAAGAGLGNAIREGVVQVWQSDAYRAFRDQLASEEPPQICRACPVYLGTASDVPGTTA